MDKLLRSPYSPQEYADFAIEANGSGKILVIQQNGDVLMTDPPPPPPEPPKTIFTKLEIRRACRELTLEAKLDALLGSSPEFGKDWADTTYIDLNDPVTLAALQSGAFTPAEIADLMEILTKKEL